MENEYDVPHSPVPLPADSGDGPFLTAPAAPDTPMPPLASVQVFNNPTENDLLGRLLYGEADCSAFIRVSDTVGPGKYKRIVRYLKIHPRKDLRDDILCIAFVGRKNDIHSHMINDMVGGPANAVMETVGNAITLLKPTIANGSPFTGDGMFEIVMAPIQADYTRDFCEKDDFMSGRYTFDVLQSEFIKDPKQESTKNPQWPIRFGFNNGHQKYIMFHGDVGRNVLISLDIINHNPITSTLIEFNIYALQMRRGS